MGFMKPPSVPAAPTPDPPTVTITETAEGDTQNQYDALNARRKGLISTIKAGQAQNASLSKTGGSNSKLG